MTHSNLKFVPNNAQAILEIKNYQEVFHPMIKFLRHHYIRPALTMDSDVPMEYIQTAYHSAKYLNDGDTIEFSVQPYTHTALTKNLLRRILELPERDYHEPPTFTQIKEMLKEIGYLGDISAASDFKITNLPGMWNKLFSILNKCITGKSGGLDLAGENVLAIMWGLVKVKDIDFLHFIWEDFVLTVVKKKGFVPYSRFWGIIIKKVLGSDVTLIGELPPKYVMDRVKMPSKQERWEVIPPMKEEMLAVIPDNSPILKKYTELISISQPEQTSYISGSSDECFPHVSQHIEDTETRIQHPRDTLVESTFFIEETPVSFDHYARIGVIPPSVDLTNMPNKHLRFDDSSDNELDPKTDSSSDEPMFTGQRLSGNPNGSLAFNSLLIQRSTNHSECSGLLHDMTLDVDYLMTEAKQKNNERLDVSVPATRRLKRRRARNLCKSYKKALSRRDSVRQKQVLEGGISRKEFDEMKANVEELVFSVKALVQLNLKRKQSKDDSENSWKRIAEYNSLTKEIKGLKADQTSSTKTLERKLNDISTKVAASTPVQTQISHILTTLHHILIFLRESKPKDDASATEISEAVSKLFNDQTQALNEKYIHFETAVNHVSENILTQSHAIERLAVEREKDAEKVVQVMTQFKDAIIEAYKSVHALTCKVERLGPSSDKDGDRKGGDGTSASEPYGGKRASSVSINELDP